MTLYSELIKKTNQLNDANFIDFLLNESQRNPNWNWSLTRKDAIEESARFLILKRLMSLGYAVSKNGNQLIYFDFHVNSRNKYMNIWLNRNKQNLISSDHMMVSRKFTEVSSSGEDIAGTDLSVSSWNMMNKCHSRENCPDKSANPPYSNNPENIDESDDEYLTRVFCQIDEIINHFKEKKSAALLLQEVNFLYYKGYPYEQLKLKLCVELEKISYALIIKDEKDVKKQAIIYDTTQLRYTNECSYEMPGTNDDNRKVLFEANFTDKNNKYVVLASMHLSYKDDYSHSLLEHARNTLNNDRRYIAGGDTNHAPNTKISGLMANFTYSTNYDLPADSRNQASATDHSCDRKKCYDGFIAASTGSFKSQQLSGRQFIQTDGGKVDFSDYPDEQNFQVSLSGHPWVRPQTLILDILGYRKEIIAAAKDIFKDANLTSLLEKQETLESILKVILSCKLSIDLNSLPSKNLDTLIKTYKSYRENDEFIQTIQNAQQLLHNKKEEKRLWDMVDSRKSINWEEVMFDKSLLNIFFEAHGKKFKNDKSAAGIFKGFKNTNVRKNWYLKDVLQHAIFNDNRSRSVCVKLGWLKNDGTLNDSAPADVKKAYNNISDFHYIYRRSQP